MKHYDPILSPNNVGDTIEPPATAHSGDARINPTCTSLMYIEFWSDISREIINTIEGAGLTLDGTDRFQLLAAIKELGVPVGTQIFSLLPPISGYIYQVGSVGEAGSGATQRANADTFDLYEGLWDNVADAEAPVSGGRGVSASADFAALKTLTMPDGRGATLVGRDDMGGLGAASIITIFDATKLGLKAGSQVHQLSESELPIVDLDHAHDVTAVEDSTANASADGAVDNEAGNQSTFTSANVTGGLTFGSNQAHANMQPTLISNIHIKL